MDSKDPSRFLNTTCSEVLSDATPRYLHSSWGDLDHLAPHRIYHLLGNRPKLIMMFRNPTDRLLSDYKYFERQKGRGGVLSAEDFHNRVVKSVKTFQKCKELFSERRCIYNYNLTQFERSDPNITTTAMSRMTIGMYAEFLTTWFSVFPRENFHIVLFEEYSADPHKYINGNIIPFLDLEPYDKRGLDMLIKKNDEVVNKAPDVTQPKAMLPQTRTILDKIYKPYNERLAKMLNDDRFLFNK